MSWSVDYLEVVSELEQLKEATEGPFTIKVNVTNVIETIFSHGDIFKELNLRKTSRNVQYIERLAREFAKRLRRRRKYVEANELIYLFINYVNYKRYVRYTLSWIKK